MAGETDASMSVVSGLGYSYSTGVFFFSRVYSAYYEALPFPYKDSISGKCFMAQITFNMYLHYPLVGEYWCHAVYDSSYLNTVFYVDLIPTSDSSSGMPSELFTISVPSSITGQPPFDECSYVKNYKSKYFWEDAVHFYLSGNQVRVKTYIYDSGGPSGDCLKCSCTAGTIRTDSCFSCNGYFYVSDQLVGTLSSRWLAGGFLRFRILAQSSLLSFSIFDGESSVVIGSGTAILYAPTSLAIIPDVRPYTHLKPYMMGYEPADREFALVQVSKQPKPLYRETYTAQRWARTEHQSAVLKSCNYSIETWGTYRCKSFDIIHSWPRPLVSAQPMYTIQDYNLYFIVEYDPVFVIPLYPTVLGRMNVTKIMRAGSSMGPILMFDDGVLKPYFMDTLPYLTFDTDQDAIWYMNNNSCSFLPVATVMVCPLADYQIVVTSKGCSDVQIYPRFWNWDLYFDSGWAYPTGYAVSLDDSPGHAVLYALNESVSVVEITLQYLDGTWILCYPVLPVRPFWSGLDSFYVQSPECTLGEFLTCDLAWNSYQISYFPPFLTPSEGPFFCNIEVSMPDVAPFTTVASGVGVDLFHIRGVAGSCIEVHAGYVNITLIDSGNTALPPSKNRIECPVRFLSSATGMEESCSITLIRGSNWPSVLDMSQSLEWVPYMVNITSTTCARAPLMLPTVYNGLRVSPMYVENCTYSATFVSGSDVTVSWSEPWDLSVSENAIVSCSLNSTYDLKNCTVRTGCTFNSSFPGFFSALDISLYQDDFPYYEKCAPTCLSLNRPDACSPYNWKIPSGSRCPTSSLIPEGICPTSVSTEMFTVVGTAKMCLRDNCNVPIMVMYVFSHTYIPRTYAPSPGISQGTIVYLAFLVFVLPILCGLVACCLFVRYSLKAIRYMEKRISLDRAHEENRIVPWRHLRHRAESISSQSTV
jgi:hypothetical protein